VPPVLAQMNRDAVGSGRDRRLRRAQRIRVQSAARIPQRRHMIDIHAEPDRAQFSH
jgi:hypothetical protein